MAKMSVVLMKDEQWRPLDEGPEPEGGFGALHTEAGPLPLKALDVRAAITGLLYQATVRQTFVNTHGRALEATYIFPLPDRAAVSRFILRVAGRVVEGQLKERGEARREYNQAIARGHRAAIAEEERPGVFTMRVGNIPPGESAEVELTLSGPLAFIEGEATFRFPLVVAPRYIPGAALPGGAVGAGVAADTDAVPDASRISPPVLLPGWKSPVRLNLEVVLDPAGLPVGGVRSSLHTTVLDEDAAGRLRLRVAPGERLDRDFVLRFSIGDEAMNSTLVLHPDQAGGQDGTFLLTLVPPAQRPGARRARDLVFVLDRSGSMGPHVAIGDSDLKGWKMVTARRALARMVDTLTDQDRFQVYAFDDRIEIMQRTEVGRLLPGTDRNRFRAVEFLAGIEARGGTEMEAPLSRAVDVLCRGESGRNCALVLITDGQVGNEAQILRSLGDRLRQIRVFTLGIDKAVNEGFLRQLATLGGGGCEIVESEERLDEVMGRVHRQIGTPVLTGLGLSPQGLALVPGSLAPARLPDLFAEAPVMILGRYQGHRGAPFGSITLRATGVDGAERSLGVEAEERDCPAIAAIWARGHIRDLEDQLATGRGGPDVKAEILRTSLRFQVLCKFTSFVAVDRVERVNPGGEQHRVVQAVEQPAGWGAQEATDPGASVHKPVLGAYAAGPPREALGVTRSAIAVQSMQQPASARPTVRKDVQPTLMAEASAAAPTVRGARSAPVQPKAAAPTAALKADEDWAGVMPERIFQAVSAALPPAASVAGAAWELSEPEMAAASSASPPAPQRAISGSVTVDPTGALASEALLAPRMATPVSASGAAEIIAKPTVAVPVSAPPAEPANPTVSTGAHGSVEPKWAAPGMAVAGRFRPIYLVLLLVGLALLGFVLFLLLAR